MSSYGPKEYKRTQVTTVDKGRLIVLLYDGAIKFIHQAKECAELGDIESKCNNINKAMDIISELNHSLNMSDGGEIALNLRRLYQFLNDRLLEGKIKKETHYLVEVEKILSTLNEAWNEVVSTPEAKESIPRHDTKSLKASVKV
ncbi:MAG: flagellar export chaperone FliS [Deltaproteobacteria bacterium]|nr:flagellar export chaperone FliS [Deltaproteobacteria bacterium]